MGELKIPTASSAQTSKNTSAKMYKSHVLF